MDLLKVKQLFLSKKIIFIGIIIIIVLFQFMELFLLRKDFKNDSELKSRQIQRLDAGINFDSKRQQFIIKARNIILKEADEKQKMTLQEAYDIAEHDFYISEKYMLDPVLMLAMQRQESRFNKNALSIHNAMGLNQLVRTTAHIMADLRGIAYSDSILFDFKINNELAATYIAYLKADFNNNMTSILIGYNAGPSWVGAKELPEETIEYLPKVRKYYDDFNKELSFYLPGNVSKLK